MTVSELTSLHAFVAGERVAPGAGAVRIHSYDGRHALAVAETSPVSLRRALRFADDCQAQLDQSSLAERIEVARLVLRAYPARADHACWALAHFRGITAADTRWMCDVNLRLADKLEELVDTIWGQRSARATPSAAAPANTLFFRSKGKAALFSSATMDGPPALVAIVHAILSGTHLIFKPSFRDAATHFALDTLYDHGLPQYAQLVRWRSEAPDAGQLNRQLVSQVSQAVIFCANETYRQILDSAAPPASNEWDALRDRVKRYGTGLPIAVVTAAADLDQAARDLVEGARLGGGRFCLSACPVLVERSQHDALVQRLIAQSSRLRAGPPLADSTELSGHDPADTDGIRELLRSFGGTIAFGTVRKDDMDVQILSHVPVNSSALHREVPGTALAVIPVDDLRQAIEIAGKALQRNLREAWTAAVLFGDAAEFATLTQQLPAFRYLRGGVVSRVKLLLPHQGAYFALDLMRRITVE